MDCVEWREEFRVGVAEIDAQHQRLFAMLAQLRGGIARQETEGELMAFIDGLIDYLKEHFSHEEGLLRDHPRWAEHHRLHWRFTEQILQFLREGKRAEGRGGIRLALEMHDFLCGWLQAHIVGTDREYFQGRAAGG
ncbi:MAG: bacteriohemerythrin [Desulfobulbaceae bacterium]|nr:bacteriohemerythrin [Desulfobulbaceae bacterium]